MNKIHADVMADVRQSGHIVVAMEEELIGYCMDLPEYYDLRDYYHVVATQQHCQLFLAANASEMRIVKQLMPDLDVRLTGNPRTDCLRPELVSIYDPVIGGISETTSSGYILINTNFGMLNSRHSHKVFSDIKESISLKDEGWVKRYKKRVNAETQWETYNMKSTFQLIGLFGRHSPNQMVLVRPHPAENVNTYTRFTSKYPNIELADSQDSSRPWILASDILIHTGCTTGAEAVAMNHPTISIQEKGSEHILFRASNNVSYLTYTAKEAYHAVQDFYAGKLKLGDSSKLKEFWPAQEGKFAAERIADEIHQFYLDLGGEFGGFKLGHFKFKKIRLADFHKQKMCVELSQVERILKQMYQQLPTGPQMTLYEISSNVFYMRP